VFILKKVWFGRALAIVCAAGLGVVTVARAAHAWEGEYIKDAIKNGIAAAKALKDLSGFSPRTDGMCVVGGWIEKGKDLAFTVKLKQGTEYIFVGSGDSDTKDLDLAAVEKGSGGEEDKVVAHDDDDDATSVVILSAEGDADVTLRLKNDDSKTVAVFAVLVMLESTKAKAKLDHLENAATQLAEAVSEITESTELDLDHTPNAISLVGCLLEPGDSKAFTRSFSKKNEYVIVGAADKNCADLDLEASKDGEAVTDEETDATPVLHFTVPEGGTAKVKISAHDATKRTFAVCAILKKKS
jgi:hypothetical protein